MLNILFVILFSLKALGSGVWPECMSCDLSAEQVSYVVRLDGIPYAKFPRSDIKVSVWNIHKARDVTVWSSLESSKADLMILQEAWLKDEQIDELEKLGQWFIVANYHTKGHFATGIATGSRVSYLNSLAFRSKTREPLIGTHKSISLTEYQWDGTRGLRVFNIHGLNKAKDEALVAQVASMKEEARYFAGCSVFAGDFNTSNKARESAIDTLFKSWGYFKLRFLNDTRKERLDHVYLKNCSAVNEALIFDKSSDHPRIEFSLRPNR